MCEVGRYHKLPYEQRICLFCTSKKVESEFHFLFECQFYNDLRHGSVIEKAILDNQGSSLLLSCNYMMQYKLKVVIVKLQLHDAIYQL